MHTKELVTFERTVSALETLGQWWSGNDTVDPYVVVTLTPWNQQRNTEWVDDAGECRKLDSCECRSGSCSRHVRSLPLLTNVVRTPGEHCEWDPSHRNVMKFDLTQPFSTRNRGSSMSQLFAQQFAKKKKKEVRQGASTSFCIYVLK